MKTRGNSIDLFWRFSKKTRFRNNSDGPLSPCTLYTYTHTHTDIYGRSIFFMYGYFFFFFCMWILFSFIYRERRNMSEVKTERPRTAGRIAPTGRVTPSVHQSAGNGRRKAIPVPPPRVPTPMPSANNNQQRLVYSWDYWNNFVVASFVW